MADLAELESVAVQAARAAGRLILEDRPPGLAVAATKSSATDVVTEMDRRSEQFLQRFLAQHRPGDGLLGEEGAHRRGTTGITWVVDPIDGTVNYLYQLPAYAVSVAACEGDPDDPEGLRPIAGAVYNPVTAELFHGRLGGGAHLVRGNGGAQRLRVSDARDLGQALLGSGFSYDSATRVRQASLLTQLLGDVRDVRRGGSAALDLCFVAAGRLDVYYESGLNPWDRLAAQLLVTEAGGVVRGLGADRPGVALVIAGPQTLVEALAPRLRHVDH